MKGKEEKRVRKEGKRKKGTPIWKAAVFAN